MTFIQKLSEPNQPESCAVKIKASAVTARQRRTPPMTRLRHSSGSIANSRINRARERQELRVKRFARISWAGEAPEAAVSSFCASRARFVMGWIRTRWYCSGVNVAMASVISPLTLKPRAAPTSRSACLLNATPRFARVKRALSSRRARHI